MQNGENKMGVMPVGRLLINVSLPMMVSMLVLALYNIVDSKYVSEMGETAFTAVSLAFPVQNLMIAVSAGTGVGMNALLSRSLGEKNRERAEKTAINGLFLAVMSALAFLILGLAFVRPFFASQTDDAAIIDYGVSYLRICCACSLFLFLQMAFERILQSTGKTVLSMISQILGAVVNIILDPIMIFGLYGCPQMGVAGAAIATVIGQAAGMTLSLIFCLRKNDEVRLRFKGFRPSGEIIGRIYAVGAPSIIMQSVSSVMTYAMNLILISFTPTATAVFGAYFKLQSFIFMPVFGLNNGLVPIVAYNHGARNKERIVKTIKLAAIFAVGIMLAGFIVFQLIPDKLISIFNASENMLSIGVVAFRIISLSFLFAGFCIVCGSVFQALGNGVMSLIVSITRQLVVLLPVAYLLSLTGNLDMVWYSFPIAELFSVTLSAAFLARIYKKVIAPLGETA